MPGQQREGRRVAGHRCTKDAAEERAGLKPGPYKGNLGWVQPFDTKRVASDPPRRADEWPFEAQGKRVTRKRKAVASEKTVASDEWRESPTSRYLDWEAWEMLEMMRRLARTR